MEVVMIISLILCITSFWYWIFDDNNEKIPFFIGTISFLVLISCIIIDVDGKKKQKKNEDSFTTIEQIEYAVNKCSPFGGLKALHTDVIICMDQTQIKMNFEPEKKVEVE